jgi:peptidylprolyl isomerase
MRALKGKMCVGLLVMLAALGGCKRKVEAPRTVVRQPRAAGPSAEDMAKEARAKLMAELEPVPALDAGTPYVAPDGEAWMRYDNGMMLHVLRPRDGMKPQLGQTVSVAYVGYLPESKQTFDKRTAENPFTFKLGSKNLVKGFNMAVAAMHPEEKIRVYLPADLAYGERGDRGAGIGANQALMFEIELLSVTGQPVGFTLEDLPKFEPLGPKLPVGGGTAPASRP